MRYERTLRRWEDVGGQGGLTAGQRRRQQYERELEQNREFRAEARKNLELELGHIEDKLQAEERRGEQEAAIADRYATLKRRIEENYLRDIQNMYTSAFRNIGDSIAGAYSRFTDDARGWARLILQDLPRIIQGFYDLKAAADAVRLSQDVAGATAGGGIGGFFRTSGGFLASAAQGSSAALWQAAWPILSANAGRSCSCLAKTATSTRTALARTW